MPEHRLKGNAPAPREGAVCHWVKNFIADDAIYRMHVAPDTETASEHVIVGTPRDNVIEVRSTIGPTQPLSNRFPAAGRAIHG